MLNLKKRCIVDINNDHQGQKGSSH